MPFSNPYIYNFVHNPLSDFYRSMLDYFCVLYPRFQWKVIGTYQKAVEFLNKSQQYGRETDQPMLPAILLNPSGEFMIDDIAGKFLWRFPDLGLGFAATGAFDPIYQDTNVKIVLCWSRLKGELIFSFLPASYYEYMDMKMFFLLKFESITGVFPAAFGRDRRHQTRSPV